MVLGTLAGLATSAILILLGLARLHPYPVWRNVGALLTATVTESGLRLGTRLRLLGGITKDVAMTLALTVPSLVDRVVCRRWVRRPLDSPVFIVGQPRSGTTFLHRTLADSGAFTSISHFHWRYPFICVWWAVDALGLSERFARRNYWPKTETGHLAGHLHQHTLGDVEEHGVFLEERLFHHYFLTRRYPLTRTFARVSRFTGLSDGEKDALARHLLDVVRKFQYFYGSTGPWLTKENESVEVYRRLIAMAPDCRVIFLLRDPHESIPSYVKLSVVSTMAKTGLDPRSLDGWAEANMQFRRDEMTDMVTLSQELTGRPHVAHVTYTRFVTRIRQTVTKLAEELDIALDANYLASLDELQGRQRVRDRGYDNDLDTDMVGEAFAEFRQFVTSPRFDHDGCPTPPSSVQASEVKLPRARTTAEDGVLRN